MKTQTEFTRIEAPARLVDPDLNAGCTWCGSPARVAIRRPEYLMAPYLWLCLRHWRQLETGARTP